MIPGASSISRVSRVGAAGGGGRLWTPADIPELTGWWDADAGLTLSGQQVTAWANKIGAGDFNQGGAGRGPTLITLNGAPTLSFDGADKWMQLPGGGAFAQPDFTSSNATLLVAAAPNKANASILSVNSGQLGPGLNANSSPILRFADQTMLVTSGTDQWTSHRTIALEWYRGASVCWRGVQNKFTAFNRSPYGFGSPTNNAPTYLGYNQDGAYYGGTIAAIAIAPALISGTDHDRWEGYYAHKFGATAYLSASHPYKSAPPRV